MLLSDAIILPSALAFHNIVHGFVGDWKIVKYLVVFFLVIFIIVRYIIPKFSSRMGFLGGIRPGLLCIRIGDGGTITFLFGGSFG